MSYTHSYYNVHKRIVRESAFGGLQAGLLKVQVIFFYIIQNFLSLKDKGGRASGIPDLLLRYF